MLGYDIKVASLPRIVSPELLNKIEAIGNVGLVGDWIYIS